MSEGKPGDEVWIAKALKAEADRHEPDGDRIWRRIRNQVALSDPSADPVNLWGQRFRRRADDPVQRSSRLLPAAAAAVVMLTAGAITALHGSDHSSGASAPGRVSVTDGAIGAGTSASATATSAAADPSSASSSSSSSSSPSVSSSTAQGYGSTTTQGPVRSSAPTGSKRRPDVVVKTAVAKAGHAVTLPGDSRDWIAAASQSATDTIRRQQGAQLISGPHVTGNPTSSKTTGPFALAWTGGMPEKKLSDSRSWRTITGPAGGPETGFGISVPATDQSAQLVLYIGAQGADGQLRVKLSDRSEVIRTSLKAGPAGTGYVVTIRFQTTGPTGTLTAELLGGDGGSVSFAAAELR